jgi:FtsH-binding integral membrane protein
MDGDDTVRSGPGWLRAGRARPAVAAAADVAWLAVFVLIGRSSHTEGESPAGVARTLWPFVVGLVLGWAVARAWRRPAAVVPTGAVVWPVCVGAAMVLRAASGQGVAAAFIGVALAFVGLGLLGWRALAQLLPARGLPGRRAPDGPA